jgi:hypothetical protein
MTDALFRCTFCGGAKKLVSAEYAADGYDLITLRCPGCGHEVREVVRVSDLPTTEGPAE